MEMVYFIPPGQRRIVMLAAQSDAPVLIVGAAGSGKGAIAKWIHDHGVRASRGFVIASRDLPLLEQIIPAHGGTFVIPEIAERPLGEQHALYTFLSSKSVPHPKTPSTPMLLNVRIIALTVHSLDHRTQAGLFSDDLLKKLNVFRVEMPDLSKRAHEFEDIAFGLLREITHELGKDFVRDFSDEAWKALKAYDWPGNIRELRNVVRLSVLRAAGDKVEPRDLPEFQQSRTDFRATREEFERVYLSELLATCQQDLTLAARLSRTDVETLRARLERHGLLDKSKST